MKNVIRFSLLLAAAAVLAFAPSAMADSSMTLTGAGPNNVAYNVYIGPYTATINGVSTPVICDDFADDSYLNESWMASVTPLADVATSSDVKWASQAGEYGEAAWLTGQLLGTSDKSTAAAIQYAVWDLFDNSQVSSYLSGFSGGTSFLTDSSDPGGVAYWLNRAGNSGPLNINNFLIYTPTSCTSGPCMTSGGLPQEFIVATPEPGTVLLLLIGLAAVCWFGTRQRRLSSPA